MFYPIFRFIFQHLTHHDVLFNRDSGGDFSPSISNICNGKCNRLTDLIGVILEFVNEHNSPIILNQLESQMFCSLLWNMNATALCNVMNGQAKFLFVA